MNSTANYTSVQATNAHSLLAVGWDSEYDAFLPDFTPISSQLHMLEDKRRLLVPESSHRWMK